jgi:hypothetical protein
VSARTGEAALDVAFVRPPGPYPVALAMGYNGAALPSRAEVDAWACPTCLGFESAVDRSFAGYDAGVADANFTADVFDAWGYPKDCGWWVCAHDGSSTPAWALPNITGYGQGFASTMRARGYTGPGTAYGENAAVDSMCAGIAAARSTPLRWRVGTWGNGEGGGPNQPPADCDCELLQSGNTPSVVPNADHDWLYAPVSTFAALNGPASAPPTPPEEDSVIYLSDHHCFLALGALKGRDFTGDRSYMGLPADAIAYANSTTPPTPFRLVSDVEAEAFMGVSKALLDLANGKLIGSGGDDTPAAPPVDLTPVRAAVTALDQALTSVGA